MDMAGLKSIIIESLDEYPLFRKALFYPYRVLKYAKLLGKGKLKEKAAWHSGLSPIAFGRNTFFGYYDISPSMGENVLFHRVSNGETLEIVKSGLHAERPEILGRTRSWSYQQGAMAQWVKLSTGIFPIFNGESEGRLGAFICAPGDVSFHPFPIELACDNGWFSINFKRLCHSEYGYRDPISPCNYSVNQPLHEDGIWFYSPEEKRGQLLIRLSDLDRSVPCTTEFINHLSLSRGGRYLIFIHRLIGRGGRKSRLYLFDRFTGRLNLILDEGFVSHYCWQDSHSFIIYAKVEGRKGYFCYDCGTGKFSPLLAGMLDNFGDGHPTVSPDGRHLLTDTYPLLDGKRRLILASLERGTYQVLASLYVPFGFFDGERCDMHPRWSQCGQYIFFDSAHSGFRELYSVSIASFIDDAG